MVLTRLIRCATEEARKLNLSVSAFIRLLIKQWSNGIKFEKRED
ncbi:hypothetical protein ES708_16881 [subsurface metagenome]